jgi:hypothetical protein
MFHVLASGSNEHPDLDYTTDDMPNLSDLYAKYQYVSVVRLHPIRLKDVLEALR